MKAATQHLGTPEKHGPGLWFVPSGKFGYHVRWLEGRYTCTCPSHRWRAHLACKHILWVRKWRRERVTMGA
jgi:hypothetical protein